MNKTGKEWIARKTANIINKLSTNSKPAPIILEWRENPVMNNKETGEGTTTLEITANAHAATGLIQETGNKPTQSTGMRKCGIQGKEIEMDRKITSQESEDIRNNKGIIKSTQDSTDRNSDGGLDQIEVEALNDNNDVKIEDSVLLRTSYKSPIGIAVYPSSDSIDEKLGEEPNNLAFPIHPRRNCPAKKNQDFFMDMNDSTQNFPGSIHKDINSNRKFTIYHQNIRGISSKIDEFQVSLCHYRPQVICLTEHHLKTEEITSINLDQYKLGAFFCRKEYKGGGVYIYFPVFSMQHNRKRL
jgi:hypothetical protein